MCRTSFIFCRSYFRSQTEVNSKSLIFQLFCFSIFFFRIYRVYRASSKISIYVFIFFYACVYCKDMTEPNFVLMSGVRIPLGAFPKFFLCFCLFSVANYFSLFYNMCGRFCRFLKAIFGDILWNTWNNHDLCCETTVNERKRKNTFWNLFHGMLQHRTLKKSRSEDLLVALATRTHLVIIIILFSFPWRYLRYDCTDFKDFYRKDAPG